jgi:GNAT superfamily N-acetyltransferase
MAPKYEFVRYHPDLKRQVVELQTHLWSPSEALNTSYFEWKYERNPYLDGPLIYLAIHNGRVVGMRGFFGVQWEAGVPAERFTSLYADDMVILPEHRNQGLMPKIMSAAFDDLARLRYDYIVSLSAGPITFLSSLSMGWRSAGTMEWMCWRPWRSAFRSGLSDLIRPFPSVYRTIQNLRSKRFPNSRWSMMDIELEHARQTLKADPWISFHDVPRCAAMAELVERIGHSGRIRHVRDVEYFHWRFQNPLSRYRFLFYEKDRLEGYLVLQEYTSEFADRGRVNIVDWEANGVAAKAELLRAAIALTRTGPLIVWSATQPPETTELLRKNGFKHWRQMEVRMGSGPAVLVRPACKERLEGEWLLAGLRMADLASWDLRMLYSMHG